MIKPAIRTDAPRMAEISVFGWRSAYRGIISDEYLFSKLLVNKRIKGFEKDFDENTYESYVFEEENIIKAFMSIGECRNNDKKDAFELWGLYVDPLMKNNGIGTQLINYCEGQATKRKFKENVLWVFKDNNDARGFYEKKGYKNDGKEELIEYFGAIEVRYGKIL
jgi:ribosomal protein S18 acetylase RimI-like enzyme